MSQIPTHSSRGARPSPSRSEHLISHSAGRRGRWALLISRALVSALLIAGTVAVVPTPSGASDPKKPDRVEKPSRGSKPQARSAPRPDSRPQTQKPARSAPPRQASPPPRTEKPSRQPQAKPRQTKPQRTESRQAKPQRTEPQGTAPRQTKPEPRRDFSSGDDRSDRPSASSNSSPTFSYRPPVDADPLVRSDRDRDGRGHTYDDTAYDRDTVRGGVIRTRGESRRDRDYRRGRGHYGYHPSYRWYRPGYAYFDGFLGYTGHGRWGWGFYSPIYCNFYGPFWAWTPALSWYWPSRHVYVDVRHSYDRDTPGALDLDVSPEKAQIFVDGDLVGVADNYDGFPTYLYLPPGTYEVAIFHPGYETIFRQYTIYPGSVIDVEDRMVRGVEIHPHDRGPTSTKNRDERIRRNRERAEEARRQAELEDGYGDPGYDDPGYDDPGYDDPGYDRPEEQAPPGDRPPPEVGTQGSSPIRQESTDSGETVGRLLLDIVPPDAAVYLDGHFIGTAAEVSGLSAGLVVEPGLHDLEVTRPGYVWRDVEVSIDQGEKLELAIELEARSP